MPKYLVLNKETREEQVIEDRKKPFIDPEKFVVTRVREKEVRLTNNQRRKLKKAH